MQPLPWPEPDAQVVAAIRGIFRRKELPLPVQIRDMLGEVFPDEEFASVFGVRGKPGYSPGRLALVSVLQRVGNLTDRQAAAMAGESLAWKYALGLALDDPGFDFSVLSEFRTRVAQGGLEQRVLDLLLAALVERGLVKSGGKQRTDSTHVISAVRDLNRRSALAGPPLPRTTRSSEARCLDRSVRPHGRLVVNRSRRILTNVSLRNIRAL